MQAPPVPKIKKFVGDVKTSCLDDEQAANDPQGIFCAILKMELLLRGVIVEDDKKLWGEVLSSVGKQLLNDQNIPKPLISGINVIAGKLAEQFANIKDKFHQMLTDASASTKRAQDLKDTRLLPLLRQDFDPLEVAKGYYLAAALLNPDKPPMWKQVLDVMILQHNDETPFEAQYIIEKLMTIASSKGNEKRSAELGLKLCQSYLNKDRTIAEESLSVLLAGSNSHLPEKDMLKVAKMAKSTLYGCPLDQLEEPDQMLYKILRLRVELAVEEAEIGDMAEKRHQQNVNRSGGTSMSTTRAACQEEILSQAQDPAQEASFGVRDVLVQTLSTDASSSSLLPECIEWTQNALWRFRERAQISKKSNNWKILLDFVLPILETSSSSSGWSLDLPERKDKIRQWFTQMPLNMQNLLLSIAYILPMTYWMLLPTNPEQSTEHFQFLWDVISCATVLEDDDKASSALSKKKESVLVTETKLAKSMIQCVLATQNEAYSFEMYQEIVNNKSKETVFPLGHLRCLVAWSGWYQPSWSLFSRYGDVRSILAASKLDAGRPLTPLEELLFDLAHADVEFLQGGSLQRASDLYQKVLCILEKDEAMDEGMKSLFTSHCNNGLARACKLGMTVPDDGTVEQFASNTLTILEVNQPIAPFHLWHDPVSASKAFAHQLSVARQLIADSLVEQGNCEEAQVILEAAVRDSPKDAAAALALGAFLLRLAFFVNAERSEEADKKAQIHLLKAAKLDPSQARPFALLGFWFEERGDMERAKGCYAKSLNLDPCDPVAGRGILRLESLENAQKYLDVALDQNSTWMGWAWNAIGLAKTMIGEDEFALVALLKAARCQDIRARDIFFQRGSAKSNEEADVMENIGLCYRRLGRYTASIRAFHLAIELTKAENSIPVSALCSCAQVELELALFEEAAEKFSEILQQNESGQFQSIAAYGQGVALLSLAERDLRDGKAGSAYTKIAKAIDGCVQLSGRYSCVHKLLGDLYSFGALIPSALFGEGDDEQAHEDGVKKQLEFVSHGESAYRSALASIESSMQSDQAIATQATYRCDIASNILLQAKLLASREVGTNNSGSRSLYEKAATGFETSLNLNPVNAIAWCGYGCAVEDPLLAQHAFCRSLQIERLLPDGYTNVGFLYTKLHAMSASEETMHVLTQVADTPLMWINRALILEQKSSDRLQTTSHDLTMVLEASDAYRAALQVMKHPDALIGLATTGMLSRHGGPGLNEKHKKNSHALLNEFLGISSYLRPEAKLLTGLVGMEQAALAKDSEWSNEEVEQGRTIAQTALSDARETKSMNLASIEKCLGKPKLQKLENKRQNPDAFEAQMQILERPNDPTCWLLLAKDAASKIDKTTSRDVVDEALRMAKKAADMLSQNMSSPHFFDRSGNSLKSSMVAEALSLVCSLQTICDDKKESGGSWGYDLQQAMMICPNNGLAQALLKCTAVQ